MTTDLQQAKKGMGCAGYGCLLLLAIPLILFVALPSYQAIRGWCVITWALHDAKSVKLVHYNPYTHIFSAKELVYGTKDLSPGEFSKVSWTFPPCPDFGMPTDPYLCTFDPHHRIVITDSAGNETIIRVCIICDHVQIGDKTEPFVTPFIWRPLLRHFFEEEGLPYTPDRYQQDYEKASAAVPVNNH